MKSDLEIPGVRTFEMIQYVSGFLEGGMDDWPANIQDAVYAAMERKSDEVQLPLTIVAAFCDVDIDSEDANKRFFLRVIASEVVAVDTRGTRH